MFIYDASIVKRTCQLLKWVGDNKCLNKYVMIIKLAKVFYRWTMPYLSSYIEKRYIIYVNHSCTWTLLYRVYMYMVKQPFTSSPHIFTHTHTHIGFMTRKKFLSLLYNESKIYMILFRRSIYVILISRMKIYDNLLLIFLPLISIRNDGLMMNKMLRKSVQNIVCEYIVCCCL